jgi:nitroreductase
MKKIKTWQTGGVRLGAVALILVLFSGLLPGEELDVIKLSPPNLKRGLPFMETLSVRASAREYAEKELSLQDLSDLLWAADGMNRPAENKSTAPSAMNAHDVHIFVFMNAGVFFYDSPRHQLVPLLAGDFRSQIMMVRPPRPIPPAGAAPSPNVTPPPPPPEPSNPPVQIVLVSDGERFKHGTPEQKFEWGALDAGIVSQNISLFCAATGLKTRPKASMNKAKIRELLKLTDAQIVFLNHPVGYAK